MYVPKNKLHTKFWIILLSLMILVPTLIVPASASGNVNEITSTAKNNTMKTAPIRAKEIEDPIPNPQYEYYLNHKEEFINGYIPPKYIFPQEKTISIRTRSSSPTDGIKKYDSRSSDTSLNHFGRNVITPPKNQYHTGTCWAHADLAVVESLLKIKDGEDYDLSEGHMAYNIDDQTNLQSGGLDQDALAYYARLTGPVLEKNFKAYTIDENDPQNRSQKEFEPSRANLLPVSERDTFKIMGDTFNKKLDVFVTRSLELDLTLENLKKCIYENGSVQGTYLIAEDGYSKDVLGHTFLDQRSVKKNGVCYHYVRNFKNSNYLKYNHSVALIGWDDDKEITNKLGEKVKGAFLVKNSIKSPSSQDKGYHWISYQSFLGNGVIVSSFTKIITPRDARLMDAAERASLKNVYNPCKLTRTTSTQDLDIKGNLNKAINVYERGTTEPETIKYVTYYNKSEGSAPYKIYITEDPELLKEEKTTFVDGTKGDTLKDIQSDKWVELASGTFTEKGYQTLEATVPYTLTSSKFALKIETESKKLGIVCRSLSKDEKIPTSSYRYNDENSEHFFQKIDDSYKIFLGVVTAKPNEYTVTVTDDGNGTATANPSKGPKGTKVNLKADPKPGYEFDKWEVEGATVAEVNSPTTTLTLGEGNVTAKAIFKKIQPKEYTVTVTDDGNGTATADPSKGPKGTKVNLKADPNQGYEFDKWEVEGTTVADLQASETTLTIGEGNVTAKAIFKKIQPKEYKVTFETTYGTKPADQKVKENGKATVPTGFEKDATEILDNASGKTYIFKGWFIGEEEYNFEREVKEDKTLKAKWEEKIIPIVEYTVSFETDYGTKPADQKIKENEKATAPTEFEKDATEIKDNASGKTYIFKGWFIGEEEYNFETAVKEDKTLTAKWEEKIIPIVEYKVSFETDYGTKPEDQKIKENEKATAPTEFEKDATEILDNTSGKTYIFKGWFIGEEEYNFETEVKENKTLKAKWEEKTVQIVEYTVNVSTDTNGTATAEPSKGPKGTKVSIKAVPKPGYEFDKWEVEGATVQDPKSPTTTLTIGEENVTAKAIFKVKAIPTPTPTPTPTPKPGIVDEKNKNQVLPINEKQGTGVIVTDPTNTIIEVRDEDGKKIPYEIEPRKHEIMVNPGRNVDGPITITVTDKKDPNRKEKIIIGIVGHTIGRDDNNSEYKYWIPYWTYNFESITKSQPQKKIVIKPQSKLVIGSKEMTKTVDGVEQKVMMDITPFIEKGRTMLPIRFVAEALGFKVEWDDKARTVILTDKDNVVRIPVDTNKIIVNRNEYESDVKPVLRNNRTMLPIGNIARALGLKDGTDIIWDAKERTVVIKREIEK